MKKIFILIIFSVIAFSAFPQSNFTALQYPIGFAAGDLHDYISTNDVLRLNSILKILISLYQVRPDMAAIFCHVIASQDIELV